MGAIQSILAALGTGIPEILLPRNGIDLSKWAVIACDQFTQDLNYWERVKNNSGGAPSSLNLVFPEVYLDSGCLDNGCLDNGETQSNARRIRDIRTSMDAYIKGEIFAPPKRCCVYLERSTPRQNKRRGLVLSVDLEQYDWAPESRTLIRATEDTVKERLPPRMEIRRGAPLELPHILLLIDDEEDGLIPSLGEIARTKPPLYETPLMMDSGAVTGWAVDTEEAWTILAAGLETLAKKSTTRYSRYSGGVLEESPFLFAVGDGNHSLATAKAVWEEYKKDHSGEAGLENHPARWALVEVENLYDPGISFEPIHRVIFFNGAPDQGWLARPDSPGRELLHALSGLKTIKCLPDKQNDRVIRIESLSPDIATAGLQPLLDDFVKQNNCAIDYIHGEDEVIRLASDPSRHAVGLILPPVRKEGLFKTVAATGPLPRKSFSMGAAEEKRFYLECRSLFI